MERHHLKAGKSNANVAKEMNKPLKEHDKSFIHQADHTRTWTRLALPYLPAGKRVVSDLYLSANRDVTETSLISSCCRGCGLERHIWDMVLFNHFTPNRRERAI